MKKGISLVVLVITIIVLVIITGTVVLTLVNNGIIEKGSNAVEEHNKREVYNAVQQEVLAVQQENIGLPMGTEFAQKLQVKLNTKYPNAGVIVAYNPETKKIDIEYTLNEKKYLLTLDEGYKLEFVETPQEPIPDPEPVYEYQEVQAVDPSLWTTIEDPDVPGEYIITKYTGTGDKLNNVTIPNKIGDKKISKVGNGTTYMAKFTGKLVVSNSLYISKRAFYNCYGITEIELEHSVQTFDATTTSYSSFYWPSSSDKLTSLNIGENCIIGSYTFANKKNISELEIKRNTTLNTKSFFSCTKMDTLTLDKGVLIKADSVFSGCTNLQSISISDDVVEIGKEAFKDCKNLENIVLPKNLEIIGANIFSGCTSLVSITISNNILIDDIKKMNSVYLTEFNVHDDNPNYSSKDGLLLSKDKTNLVLCPKAKTRINIPSTVSNIKDTAFMGCVNLTNITISSTVLSVEEDNNRSSFANCTNLQNVEFEYGIVEIPMYAFIGCTSLTSVTIPNSVTIIGSFSFMDCRGLTNIDIPNSVVYIYNQAFDSCVGLTNIVLPNSVQCIKRFSFKWCTGLTSISIPNSVTEIERFAFHECGTSTTIIVGSEDVQRLVLASGYTGTVIIDSSIN